MSDYTCVPLGGADEIRVLKLEPSRDRTAPLRGSLKTISLASQGPPPLNSTGVGTIIASGNGYSSAAGMQVTTSYGDAANITATPILSPWNNLDSQWRWWYNEEMKSSTEIVRNKEGKLK